MQQSMIIFIQKMGGNLNNTVIKKKSKRLLIFDSGVGGLSIYISARKQFPSLEIHYLSDNDAFPYGDKSVGFLTKRVIEILELAMSKISPDILIIGCNTISTLLLDKLRDLISIPIIGVVPAIKTAATISKTKSFALLATNGTIARKYTDDLIERYASNHNVYLLGASDLVSHIESYVNGEKLDHDFIKSKIETIKNKSDLIDTIVLGCTHFPLIRNHFKNIDPKIQWVDSTNAITSRVNNILNNEELTNVENYTIWSTKHININNLNFFLKESSFNEFNKLL